MFRSHAFLNRKVRHAVSDSAANFLFLLGVICRQQRRILREICECLCSYRNTIKDWTQGYKLMFWQRGALCSGLWKEQIYSTVQHLVAFLSFKVKKPVPCQCQFVVSSRKLLLCPSIRQWASFSILLGRPSCPWLCHLSGVDWLTMSSGCGHGPVAMRADRSWMWRPSECGYVLSINCDYVA